MMDFASTTNLALPISDIVLLFFYLAVGLYAVFTTIFYYHWQAYASDIKVTGLTFVMYFATTIPLLLIMGTMVLVI